MIHNGNKEADDLFRYLQFCGIKDMDILVENEARNTYENATFTARLLHEKNLMNGKHLVITSAFHLRRAMLCFNKTELVVEGFSTDFYGNKRSFTLDKLLIPDPSAFSDWQLVIKEIEGLILYKLIGYL